MMGKYCYFPVHDGKVCTDGYCNLAYCKKKFKDADCIFSVLDELVPDRLWERGDISIAEFDELFEKKTTYKVRR